MTTKKASAKPAVKKPTAKKPAAKKPAVKKEAEKKTKEKKPAAISKKTVGKPFEKGQSGNPSGRPKLDPEQKDALDQIRKLAPRAVEIAQKMLEDEKAPANIRVKLIEMILDRAYGKPYQAVQIEDSTAHEIKISWESEDYGA